jgi:predicted nucleic acid-binding protein
MAIFIDTSAIYALLDAGDCNHDHAKTTWAGWLDHPPMLVCSNYVLLESIVLVQRRLGITVVRRFQEELAPLFHVHWVNHDLHSIAIGVLLAAGRRNLSLVDCTSFELMRRLGIRTAFAFDRHFAEQGFDLLPGGTSPG